MKVIEHTDQDGSVKRAAAIGMFDGVHLGHMEIIRCLKEEASKRGLETAVISFRNHPQLFFKKDSDLKMLMSLDDRLRKLSDAGVDTIILFDFDKPLSQLSAYDFIKKIRDEFGVSLLMIGFNHRFGHNKSDNFYDYCRYGKELGVEIIKGKEYAGIYCPVSSSIIRKLILAGKVDDAMKCLGVPFTLKGKVVHGFKKGREIGFPTANIIPENDRAIIPHNGVYAVNVILENGERYGGMVNIGTRPTFTDEKKISIEVNIFDFAGDIYGQNLTLEFIKFIRSETKMESVEMLIKQLKSDEVDARHILKNMDNLNIN